MSKQMKIIIFSAIGLLVFSSWALADDDRHIAVDQAIGGMEQGSRIGAPGSTPIPITDAHKTISSSQGTKKAGASSAQPVTAGENHGNIYTNTGQANNTAGSGGNGSETVTSGSQPTQPDGTAPTETSGSVEVNTGGTGVEAGASGTGQVTNPVDTTPNESPTEPINNLTEGATGTGETGTGETSTGSGGTQTGTGPTEPSSNPIIDADVNINPDSGTVEADVTVDTTGELEEREIFEADLEAEGVTSIDADVASAADVTGQEVIEETDVTTAGQTGQTNGSTQVETPTLETTNPPTTESGSTSGGTQETSQPSSNPIVDADVNVNPESGAVEADATVDTSGELEERQILDADVGAGETVVTETEVGSATDITQAGIVQGADITTEPVQTVIPIPSDLTAEVDTTGATSGGEADVGIEADVEGISEGEDVTCDPADGLTSAACGIPML